MDSSGLVNRAQGADKWQASPDKKRKSSLPPAVYPAERQHSYKNDFDHLCSLLDQTSHMILKEEKKPCPFANE